MCPKGLISGFRVKIAAELIRPSGLFFFQIKAIKFGANEGQNKILPNVNPVFYHNRDNLLKHFYAFSTFMCWQSPLALWRLYFF